MNLVQLLQNFSNTLSVIWRVCLAEKSLQSVKPNLQESLFLNMSEPELTRKYQRVLKIYPLLLTRILSSPGIVKSSHPIIKNMQSLVEKCLLFSPFPVALKSAWIHYRALAACLYLSGKKCSADLHFWLCLAWLWDPHGSGWDSQSTLLVAVSG